MPSNSRKRAIVYIDGFNAYYGVFKHRPAAKWLDVRSFYQTLRPHETVVGVNYFTALIDPDNMQSARRLRQERYLSALRTLDGVRVIQGRYQSKPILCGRCHRDFQHPEEKKTDVNIAVRMLSDAIDGLVEQMVVISGDTDIQPAVLWVRERFPHINVSVYIPSVQQERTYRRVDYYRSIGVLCRYLPLDDLEKHQLPNPVTCKNGMLLHRPLEWT